jgi:hypothetical protein
MTCENLELSGDDAWEGGWVAQKRTRKRKDVRKRKRDNEKMRVRVRVMRVGKKGGMKKKD